VRRFFERFEARSPDQQLAWIQPVLNKVTPLLTLPQLRCMFGCWEPIPFRRLIQERPGFIILISLAVDQMHEGSHLAGGLLLSSLHGAVVARADEPESKRVPVHIYVDEFAGMAIKLFENIIAEGRRFKFGLCVSHQNSRQLTPQMKEALRTNSHTQFYFQTGALEARELADEVVGLGKRSEVRERLMGLPVGEAILVKRGEDSRHIEVHYSEEPSVEKEKVKELRAVARANFGRLRAEVERELNDREDTIRQMECRLTTALHQATLGSTAAGSTAPTNITSTSMPQGTVSQHRSRKARAKLSPNANNNNSSDNKSDNTNGYANNSVTAAATGNSSDDTGSGVVQPAVQPTVHQPAVPQLVTSQAPISQVIYQIKSAPIQHFKPKPTVSSPPAAQTAAQREAQHPMPTQGVIGNQTSLDKAPDDTKTDHPKSDDPKSGS
jgi:hypothetical protein